MRDKCENHFRSNKRAGLLTGLGREGREKLNVGPGSLD
jgi:hypothetical protein